MDDRLEIRRWIRVNHPSYAVAMLAEGQYIAVGMERGMDIFDVTGHRLFSYPPGDIPVPVHQLASADQGEDKGGEDNDKVGQLYVGARQGWLVRLDLKRDGETFEAQSQTTLYQADNDLYTMSLSSDSGLIAVGHLSPGLALLDTAGQLLWRRHPDDGTATGGQVWAVALNADGSAMYVGSAGSGANRLVALEARSGTSCGHRHLEDGERATVVAALPSGHGVAVVLTEETNSSRVVAYDSGLTDPIWECVLDDQVTALTTDFQQPILAASVGYRGEIILMDTQTGRTLASGLFLKSVVNGLTITRGRSLAAVTQDGQLALIRYISGGFQL